MRAWESGVAEREMGGGREEEVGGREWRNRGGERGVQVGEVVRGVSGGVVSEGEWSRDGSVYVEGRGVGGVGGVSAGGLWGRVSRARGRGGGRGVGSR